ncbi:hypothetical protein [Streptomyces sp. NPDC088141]|uniref:hypothetical protein n=1 Tax=Streptomyces sp. NPDC088141 TaxID=3155179 RepID=UPI003437C4C2
MHVDGVSCPHLEPADLRTFTLIAGVTLFGSATADAGALHYLPGEHLRMARYFATDWALGQAAQTPSDIDAQDGTALTAVPGDVIGNHLPGHNHPRIAQGGVITLTAMRQKFQYGADRDGRWEGNGEHVIARTDDLAPEERLPATQTPSP